jgi:hypothetical protein
LVINCLSRQRLFQLEFKSRSSKQVLKMAQLRKIFFCFKQRAVGHNSAAQDGAMRFKSPGAGIRSVSGRLPVAGSAFWVWPGLASAPPPPPQYTSLSPKNRDALPLLRRGKKSGLRLSGEWRLRFAGQPLNCHSERSEESILFVFKKQKDKMDSSLRLRLRSE